MFLAESREHLDALNVAVVRVEEAPDDRETIDEIFRIAHSLKGMSATMGFERIATLTHEVENVFELLRQRSATIGRDVVDALFACLDALGGALGAIEADGNDNLEHEPLVELLRGLVGESTAPAPAAPRVLHLTARLAEDVQMPAVRAY